MEFGLLKFVNNKYLSDVTIKVEDSSYKAHKVVLAGSSEYYFRLFENDSKNEVSFPPYVEPKFNSVPIKSLIAHVLGYMYSDQDAEMITDKLNEETANTFMAISFSLGIASLLEISVEYIIDHLLTGKNSVAYLLEGLKFFSQTLIDASTNQIIRNFEDLIKDSAILESFSSLPFKNIKHILSSDDLKVENEKAVFETVSFLAFNEHKKLKDEEVVELFGIVRWPFLTHSDLLVAAGNPKMIGCKDLILEGISVQLSEHIKPKDYEYKVIKVPRHSFVHATSSTKSKKPEKKSLESPIRLNSKSQNNWKSFPRIETDAKKPSPPQKFFKTFSTPIKEFKYSFDFDENGTFFMLGSEGLTESWRNPGLTGKVLPFASSIASGAVEDLAGRTLSGFRTKNESGSYIGVDLGDGRGLKVSAYTLKNGTSASATMLCWNFQGSNNGSDWVVLDRRMHNSSEDVRFLSDKGRTSTWGVGTCEKAYRLFRIVQTEKNLAGNYVLSLSCFELYGQILGENWEL